MGEVVSVFLYLLQSPSYDVINGVIMSDADCTPGRKPRSVAASIYLIFMSMCNGVANQSSVMLIA